MFPVITFSFLSLVLISCSHSPAPIAKKEVSSQKRKPNRVKRSSKIAKKPSKKDLHLKKGNQFSIDGLYREAIHEYREVLNIEKNNLAAHRMIGIIHVKTGEYRKAIRHLEKNINKLESDFEANFYLAEAYRTQDRYGDAIFRYKFALTQKPNHKLTLKALSWSYYKIRYYKAALETSIKLKKVSPRDIQSTIILARVLNKIGKPQKALSQIRKALLSSPKEYKPYLNSVLGDVFLGMNNVKKAEASYKAALKEQPLLAGALLGLAKTTLEQGGPPDVAITFLERAGRIKPSLFETFFYLGKAHKDKKPKVSKKYRKKFRQLASGDPEYNEQLSEVRKMLSKKNRPKKEKRL